MRTTRTLLTAMALGIGGSLGASAGLVYDPEFTTEWFDAGIQNLTSGATLSTQQWTLPTEPDAVTVGDGKITLDTDLESPLSYTTPSAYSNVAVVAATFTVTPNAAFPEIDEAPQAALTVVASGGSTNWVGLVGDATTNKWVTFEATSDVPAPVAGKTYSVSILFDQRSSSERKIRYLVDEEPLCDWVPNPKSEAPNISSVSFSGSGDITALAGTNIIETAATFGEQSFSTFDAALAAAKKGDWSASKPVVLFKDATYEAQISGPIYINANGRALTISGGVYTQTGYTYDITINDDCEAKIGDQYYATFAEAFTAAVDGQTIEIQKQVAGAVGALDVAKTLTLSECAYLSGCTELTVAADKTLTIAGALAVNNATVNGSVAGDALTVSGTLTGTAVAKLEFAANATFAYAGTPLAPMTTLTLPESGTVAIDFTVVPDNGAPIITASGLDADKFTGAPNGRVFKVADGSLTLAPGATISKTIEAEGFDYTNGTVSVTASVESGKTGTATLKVVDFATGNVITSYDAKTIGSDVLTWQLADALEGERLTPGGTYSYVVEVAVDNVVVATQAGTFTAAKWPSDIWFGADASKPANERELYGEWESTKEPAVVDNAYVIEDDALFNVDASASGKGVDHVTRVDAVVTFESLIDADSLETESDALGGFVAAKSGDVPQWMALTAGDPQPSWAALTGDVAPEANVQYVVRAEIDFQSAAKRVRYLVSTDGTNFYPLALEGGAQWLALADATKTTLAKVELKGAGSLAKFEAWIADKAVAKVDNTEYDTMAAALEVAKDNGKAITLLTNATIEPPQEKGKYEISAGNYQYVSDGQVSSGDKTIIVDEGGKPLVRPSETVMEGVSAPGLTNGFRDTDSLREFLERNGVKAYTEKSDAKSEDITTALENEGENGLAFWQDYALGIDPTNSVAPVTTPAGDTSKTGITLAIPAIDMSKYSKDYTIDYQVKKGETPVGDPSDNPSAIQIPLNSGTGIYTIKAVFKPANR